MVCEPPENLGKEISGYEPGGRTLLLLLKANPPTMDDPVAGVEQVKDPEELGARACLTRIHGVD